MSSHATGAGIRDRRRSVATGKRSETMPPTTKVIAMLSAAKKNMLPHVDERAPGGRSPTSSARRRARARRAGSTTNSARGRIATRLFGCGMSMSARNPDRDRRPDDDPLAHRELDRHAVVEREVGAVTTLDQPPEAVVLGHGPNLLGHHRRLGHLVPFAAANALPHEASPRVWQSDATLVAPGPHADAVPQTNPSGSVNDPASPLTRIRCDPVPSAATPADFASARRL